MRLVLAASVVAAILCSVPSSATELGSLSGFVQSCAKDNAGCRSVTYNAILSARNAKYGCIPTDVTNDEAADKLLNWLKGTAIANPKFEKEALADLFWTGVDEIWPCKK